MHPYIHLGSLSLSTYKLLSNLAGVCAVVLFHYNLKRHGEDKVDALSTGAFVFYGGWLGGKLWSAFEDLPRLNRFARYVVQPGLHDPLHMLRNLLEWFNGGYTWYGGMIVGVAVLALMARHHNMPPLRMMDMGFPAGALGYAVGRLGCLLDGDGDYGRPTNLPWGMAFPHGVAPTPPGVRVHPTPIYETLFALALTWLLWELGKRPRGAGYIAGMYLLLAGAGRFLVEIVRINPKIYWPHNSWGSSNAQVVSVVSMVAGAVLIHLAKGKEAVMPGALDKDEGAGKGTIAYSSGT